MNTKTFRIVACVALALIIAVVIKEFLFGYWETQGNNDGVYHLCGIIISIGIGSAVGAFVNEKLKGGNQ